jgi:2-phosphosulfolactate phosphatase
MKIKQYTLEDCHQIVGTAAVIDVRRAFTTAAWAFHQGARRILLTDTVEQALGLRRRFPGSLILGEVGGLPVPEFDLWNSPTQVSEHDLTGKTIIQRTSAGTQGVMRSTRARQVIAASLVVASATVGWLRQHEKEQIGFVTTGVRADDSGAEDIACANYMTALFQGEEPNPQPYTKSIFAFPEKDFQDSRLMQVFLHDLELCAQVDRFNFAMPVQRQSDLMVMETVNSDE